MRIIAGQCRSRQILAPRGMETRPTYDRVRETIFDILQFRVPGAAVLDLYTGSGAMALESLSRGAERAVMCDVSGEAAETALRNAELLSLRDRCEVLRMADTSALRLLAERKDAFDLVFLDPPYRMDTSSVMAAISEAGLVRPGGIMAAEFREMCPLTPTGFTLWKDRRIGQVCVRMYEREE